MEKDKRFECGKDEEQKESCRVGVVPRDDKRRKDKHDNRKVIKTALGLASAKHVSR